MNERTLILTLSILLLSFLIVRAQENLIGLALLGGVGLIGLFVLHILAGDIREIASEQFTSAINGINIINTQLTGLINNAGQATSSFIDLFNINRPQKPNLIKKFLKRSVDSQTMERRIDHVYSDSDNEVPDFQNILNFDPRGCARRYVCTISTKSVKKLTQTEKNIINMMRRVPKYGRIEASQEEFIKAIKLGERTRDQLACAAAYPKCTYSISQMLKLIGL